MNNNKEGFDIKQLQRECDDCEKNIKKEAEEQAVEKVLMDVIHELRNPLTSIGGFADRITKKIDLGVETENGILFSKEDVEKIKKYNEIISKEMVRLNKILNTAVDFVSHQHQLELENIDINSIINDVIDMEMDERIKFESYLNFDKLINIDSTKIKMSILNFVINAKEAILDQSDQTKKHNGIIKIVSGSEKDQMFFSVSNNGPQIPQEIIDKIFYPLFSTKEDGSGVGLAISKAIVRAHKGRIDVKSNSEETTFTVYLPLYQ
ncbi:MAG: ATP-binding protein [Patescibacteria group bacterium]